MENRYPRNWARARVLVTGATGLLGPTLIQELLCNGAQVVALVRDFVPDSRYFFPSITKNVTTVPGDLSDIVTISRILNEYEIDYVFHLGAQTIVGIANRSPLSTFVSNIQGTWNLLEACRLSPWIKKIIVASSDKAYGDQPILPYTEDAPLQGKHPYDVSKSCADLIAQSYFHTYKLPVCVTRCGNFFGAGDFHFNRIIPGTIQAVIENRPPVIRSNGLFVRDYIYVKDVANAYMTLAEEMNRSEIIGQCFNFSTDHPFNVIEIVEEILSLMNVSHLKPIIQNIATNEIPNQHLSSAKAAQILGWKAKYGVREGLKETIEWYKLYFSQQQKISPIITHENDFDSNSLL